MSVVVEEIKNLAKAIAKDVSETDINTASGLVEGWAKEKIRNVFGEQTITTDIYFYNSVVYLPKKFKPISSCKVIDTNEYLKITPDRCGVYADKHKGYLTQCEIKYGYSERLTFVETVLAKMTAELALQISKKLICVDSITNNFDVSSITQKLKFTTTADFEMLLNDYIVDDYYDAWTIDIMR